MADLPATHSVSVDADIVGRVSDHHLGELALQQTFVVFGLRGVAAEQAMLAQLPNIAQLADCLTIDRDTGSASAAFDAPSINR
jgi:hypothetical protein